MKSEQQNRESNIQVSDMHELCEAYRDGYKWYGFDGFAICHAHKYKSAINDYDLSDSKGEIFWQLEREICFRVYGSYPFRPDTPAAELETHLDRLTAQDMITIGQATSRVLKCV